MYQSEIPPEKVLLLKVKFCYWNCGAGKNMSDILHTCLATRT